MIAAHNTPYVEGDQIALPDPARTGNGVRHGAVFARSHNGIERQSFCAQSAGVEFKLKGEIRFRNAFFYQAVHMIKRLFGDALRGFHAGNLVAVLVNAQRFNQLIKSAVHD